jgi:hypothetical protein
MPVIVRLRDYLNDTDAGFEVNGKQSYAKVGFAAARWARAALRNARLGEGSASASLHMEITFSAVNGTAVSADSAVEVVEPRPKRRPRKKAK